MKEVVKPEKCPYCGGEEWIETVFSSHGGVYLSPTRGGLMLGAAVFATVCRDCGSIVRLYCKDTEHLLPKKERRA